MMRTTAYKKRALALVLFGTVSLSITACSNDAALADYLDAQRPTVDSPADSGSLSVPLSDIYSVQWSEFAIACPGAIPGFAAHIHTPTSALVLKTRNNEEATRAVEFDRTSTLDLCAITDSAVDLKFRPLDTALNFHYNTDSAVWELTPFD